MILDDDNTPENVQTQMEDQDLDLQENETETMDEESSPVEDDSTGEE